MTPHPMFASWDFSADKADHIQSNTMAPTKISIMSYRPSKDVQAMSLKHHQPN